MDNKLNQKINQVTEKTRLCQAFLGNLLTPVFPALYFCTRT